jgi:hypothetical protein
MNIKIELILAAMVLVASVATMTIVSNPAFAGGFALYWAGPFFGINLPSGRESPAFIGNVTQMAKMGFDSPQNAKLFIQLESIALNSSSHPGNRTLTTPAIERITSILQSNEK